MNEITSTSPITYDEDDCDCAAESLYIDVTGEEETAWTKTIVVYFLEECMKKKNELHNPRHRRNKFFSDIRDKLATRGFSFSVKTLEKKFHNLKKHFYAVCQNKDRGTSPGKPITWPYFEQMMEIYSEELEIEDAPTMASLYPDPVPPKTIILVQPPVEPKPEPEPEPSDEDITDGTYSGNGKEESVWSHKAVIAFLRECERRKLDFWDPHVRRRKIFSDIRHRLKKKGWNFFEESLDRKLRNMKQHFQVVTDSARRSDKDVIRRRRVTWPYYEHMKAIYGEHVERQMFRLKAAQKSKIASVAKESSSMTTLKFRPIASETAGGGPAPSDVRIIVSVPAVPKTEPLVPTSCNDQENIPDDEEKTSIFMPTSTDGCFMGSPGEFDKYNASCPSQEDETNLGHNFEADASSPSHEDVSQEKTIDFVVTHISPLQEEEKFYRDVLALEERRTVVAEQLIEAFAESNKIRERRLEFKRIKLEYTNAKVKRKTNGQL